MMEFTRVDHDFLIPMAFAVAGAISAFHLIPKRAADSTPAGRDARLQVLASVAGE
jgi:hypothetical protein